MNKYYISVKCITSLRSLNFVVMKLFKKHSKLVIVDVVAFSDVHNFPIIVNVILNSESYLLLLPYPLNQQFPNYVLCKPLSRTEYCRDPQPLSHVERRRQS